MGQNELQSPLSSFTWAWRVTLHSFFSFLKIHNATFGLYKCEGELNLIDHSFPEGERERDTNRRSIERGRKMRRVALSDVMACGSMVVVEGCIIGLTIMASTAMAKGMSPFVFVVYTNALSSLILLPYSFFFDTNRYIPYYLVLCFFFNHNTLTLKHLCACLVYIHTHI